MPIRLLPPEVATKIAAGEVVERPASVVKELVENALDAGATEIRIEIRQGGRRLVAVRDNGCGIPAAEVELAFARHATSKLSTVEDLSRVTTLGFRGEALASIAAVSRVTMVTRTVDETVATQLRIEGGLIQAREPVSGLVGTSVRVENLFYNVPARLKFLRAAPTETSHISAVVMHYALAYPHVRFSLISDERLTFRSVGNGRLYDACVAVFGLSVAQQMIELETRMGEEEAELPPGDIRIRGYVGMPSLHRASRDQISLFVNRRWVQDRALTQAVVQAYHTLLPGGRQPVAVVFIELDPADVDVNVHPTKREVRFRDSHAVFSAVQRAVRRALVERSPVRQVPPPSGWPGSEVAASRQAAVAQAGQGVRQFTLEPPSPPEQVPAVELPALRVLGQLGQTYIVAEGPDGLYLIDQHAAHERVLYEQFMAQQASQIAVQTLLEPALLELTPAQAASLEAQVAVFARLGFTLEPFGPQSYLVRAVPALLAGADLTALVAEMLNELKEASNALDQEREARLVAAICKQGAIKSGQVLSLPEMRELVRQLEATTSPHTCPHGRPTMIHLSAAHLARQFGRV